MAASVLQATTPKATCGTASLTQDPALRAVVPAVPAAAPCISRFSMQPRCPRPASRNRRPLAAGTTR